jgi:hypothetical protein
MSAQSVEIVVETEQWAASRVALSLVVISSHPLADCLQRQEE